VDEAKEVSPMSISDQELCSHIARMTREKRLPAASKQRIFAALRSAMTRAEPARGPGDITGEPRKH
jgi:hypothetical protein